VVTPLCIFTQRDGRLTVESIHSGVMPETLRAATGFPVDVGPETPVTPPPTEDELRLLAEIDPERVTDSEFTSTTGGG
jgi:glutaconate CoA-transferase subunit B